MKITSFIINGITYTAGSSATIPGIGSITISELGLYTFVPNNYWSGVVPNILYSISDGYGGTSLAELIITVTPIPHYIDLEITKLLTNPDPMVTDSIFKNGTLTFTIILKNKSSILDATNIVVLDSLPSSFTYISSTVSSGSYDTPTGIWTLNQLNANDSAIITVTAIVDTSGQNDVYTLAQIDYDTYYTIINRSHL